MKTKNRKTKSSPAQPDSPANAGSIFKNCPYRPLAVRLVPLCGDPYRPLVLKTMSAQADSEISKLSICPYCPSDLKNTNSHKPLKIKEKESWLI
jgi:hypothetical protein